MFSGKVASDQTPEGKEDCAVWLGDNEAAGSVGGKGGARSRNMEDSQGPLAE